MPDLITGASAPLTMSSREIADLTGKRHADVLRDARTMLEQLGQDERSFASVYVAGNGEQRPQLDLPKDLTITLVAGYSVVLRHRIVTRWQELEARQAIAISQTLPEALRLAADLAEKHAQAQAALAVAEPKAAALDRLSASAEAVTITQAAKLLGVKREALTTWMHAKGWVYRLNGSWVAYQAHIDNGDLQYKEARYTDESFGQVIKPYCRIFPKGLAKLSRFVGKEAA